MQWILRNGLNLVYAASSSDHNRVQPLLGVFLVQLSLHTATVNFQTTCGSDHLVDLTPGCNEIVISGKTVVELAAGQGEWAALQPSAAVSRGRRRRWWSIQCTVCSRQPTTPYNRLELVRNLDACGTKLSTMGQSTRPTQPSIPPGSVKE